MNTSLQLFLTSIIFLINFPVLNIGDQLKQLLEKENEISTEYCSHNFKEQESSLSTSNNGNEHNNIDIPIYLLLLIY